MNAEELLRERRSVRKFKDEKVDKAIMTEIVELSRWAPSWANTQVARYTITDNEQIIESIANEAVKGFSYNMKTLKNAKGVAILSYVKGLSGMIQQYNIDSGEDNTWDVFDAGIACQTFCLAAHSKGVGTCIFGVIDQEKIAELVNLPSDQSVAALIVYGYEEGEHAQAAQRKDVDQILRFV
ncbi:MAG: nitroreductase family protein [Marinifilaceae bacterium]|jgi:nitroreductase|nr:nitroreductase family protein [Marinifilaceae bacterium]